MGRSHTFRLRLSLLQMLLLTTGVACSYAMLQSPTVVMLVLVIAAVGVALGALTGLIVLLLTLVEIVLYAAEHVTRVAPPVAEHKTTEPVVSSNPYAPPC
jgi:hypothetical protein